MQYFVDIMKGKKLGNKVIQTISYDQKMVPVPIFANTFNHFCQIINLMKKKQIRLLKEEDIEMNKPKMV